ncbi:MAG: hypothetical protein ABEI13_00560 [Candidatus Paceibacteria bacterium]
MKNSNNYYYQKILNPIIQWEIDGEIKSKEFVGTFKTVRVPQSLELNQYCEYVPMTTTSAQNDNSKVVIGHEFSQLLQHNLPSEVDVENVKLLLCPKEKQKE